jgi:hypothetical protein
VEELLQIRVTFLASKIFDLAIVLAQPGASLEQHLGDGVVAVTDRLIQCTHVLLVGPKHVGAVLEKHASDAFPTAYSRCNQWGPILASGLAWICAVIEEELCYFMTPFAYGGL